MDDDKFALVEKIIKDVDNIMSKNAELYSFDIVPSETNFQNKSPVLHIENCLGLESWCIKHVYMYCYSELFDKYFSKSKRKPCRLTSLNSDRLTRLLNIILLINPDLNMLWNKRRELVERGLLDKHSELLFAKLVLSRKPKANDAFVYRRWLLLLIFEGQLVQTGMMETLINAELSICDLAAEKCPNNYHSWNHRIWLLNELKKLNKQQFDLNSLLIKEYVFSERWSSKHVSDYSCFHYRQFCILNIFKLSSECWKIFDSAIDTNLRKSFVRIISLNFPKKTTIQISQDDLVSYTEENLVNLLMNQSFHTCSCHSNDFLVCRKLEVLFHELALNNELLSFFKYHETLWYHRKFIIHTIIEIMYNYFGLIKQKGILAKKVCIKCNLEDMKQAKIVKYDVSEVYSNILFNIMASHENKFIIERRVDSDPYADRHEKYLRFVEGFNNAI